MTKQRPLTIGNGMASGRVLAHLSGRAPGTSGNTVLNAASRVTSHRIMPSQAARRARVGMIDDLPTRCARQGTIGAMTPTARAATDRIFAFEDKSPHKNGPLSQGIAHDGCVTGPLQNWVILPKTGSAQGAANGATPTFPVRVEGPEIFLSLQSGA